MFVIIFAYALVSGSMTNESNIADYFFRIFYKVWSFSIIFTISTISWNSFALNLSSVFMEGLNFNFITLYCLRTKSASVSARLHWNCTNISNLIRLKLPLTYLSNIFWKCANVTSNILTHSNLGKMSMVKMTNITSYELYVQTE